MYMCTHCRTLRFEPPTAPTHPARHPWPPLPLAKKGLGCGPRRGERHCRSNDSSRRGDGVLLFQKRRGFATLEKNSLEHGARLYLPRRVAFLLRRQRRFFFLLVIVPIFARGEWVPWHHGSRRGGGRTPDLSGSAEAVIAMGWPTSRHSIMTFLSRRLCGWCHQWCVLCRASPPRSSVTGQAKYRIC